MTWGSNLATAAYAAAVRIAASALATAVVDHAGAAAARQVRECPAREHDEAVLQADEVDDVDAEPGAQATKPVTRTPFTVADRAGAADRR